MPVGRDAVDALVFPRLRFDPPRPEEARLSNGVTVLHLEDRTLPVVDIEVRFRGGYGHFPRDVFGAATALAALMRTGGTASLPPDSVDRLIDLYALDLSTTSGGVGTTVRLGTLSRHLDTALGLWSEMILAPRFDADRLEVWRGRELENVRRRADQPAALAFAEFNRILFRDHHIGWILEPDDLGPERVTVDALRRLHRRVACVENAVVGVAGDLALEDALARLEATLGRLPACTETLPTVAPPRISDEPGVYLLHRELDQSTVVMGHRGGILLDDSPEYFASRIADQILGAGGFTSRLTTRIRSELGLAYTVASIWGAGTRHERVFGVTTQTRPGTTIAAVREIRAVLEGMLAGPPDTAEVRLAADGMVNGWVFGFDDPARIVSRHLAHRTDGLPDDWLDRYLAGVQRVGPADVHRVMVDHVRPDRLTILIVGDTTRFDASPAMLGPVRSTAGHRRP